MSFENAHPNAGAPQVDGISDLPAAGGLAMLAAVTPAPNQRKKEVKSTRSKEIARWKTKAYDACQILVNYPKPCPLHQNKILRGTHLRKLQRDFNPPG